MAASATKRVPVCAVATDHDPYRTDHETYAARELNSAPRIKSPLHNHPCSRRPGPDRLPSRTLAERHHLVRPHGEFLPPGPDESRQFTPRVINPGSEARRVKESNSRELPRPGFQDRLPATGRHPPFLIGQTSRNRTRVRESVPASCPRLFRPLAGLPLQDSSTGYRRHGWTSHVGLAGFEPTTSASRTRRATNLRYNPL